MDNLDKMIYRITTKASNDNEVFLSFQQLLEENIKLPVDCFVIGEPVSVTAIEYNGNARRGLTAKCIREDGSVHMVAITEIMFPKNFKGGQHIAAYLKWLNIDTFPAEDADNIDLSKPVELIVLSLKEQTARCRLIGHEGTITLRAAGIYDLVPGVIVTVKPKKQWRYGGHPYLSCEIQSTRLDVKALGLVPLGLEDMGVWSPKEHSWRDVDEPVEDWNEAIIAAGPRPMFEMTRIHFKEYDNDPFNDPFCRAADLNNAGQNAEAKKIMMELCQADLRCLDAHSHLGNFAFDDYPDMALQHYEVGLRIGELSLGNDFTSVLLWGFIDNRPFLRCMHGYGLCLWRLGRFEAAEQVFDRMLWINPSDNQGVRFIINEVKAEMTWEDYENREGRLK